MIATRSASLPAIAFAALLILSAVAPPAVAATTDSHSTAQVQTATEISQQEHARLSTSSNTITQEITFDRTPNKTGEVKATYDYDLPSSVSSFTVRFPKPSTRAATPIAVTDTENVENETRDDRPFFTYTWSEKQQGDPSITISMDVSSDRFQAPNGGVDTEDWAFVQTIHPSIRWEHYGSAPDFARESSTAGAGYTTEQYVFLGEHSVVEQEATEETIRVVVPDAASPVSQPDTISSELARASDKLEIGGKSDTVHAFILPSSVPSSNPGAASGDSFWVQGDVSIQSDTWYHEYVHTRQEFDLAEDLLWMREGSAEYFGLKLQVNLGHEEYVGLQNQFQTRTADGVLSEPGTWEYNPQYVRGSKVLAVTDQKLRESSNGRVTLSSFFQTMNQQDDQIHGREFIAAVDDRTDGDYEAWGEQYINRDNEVEAPTSPYTYTLASVPDPDNDRLDNAAERQAGSNPFIADTDDDGLTDSKEVHFGTDPTVKDTDGDGLDDSKEVEIGTDPNEADTDDDGLSDKEEQNLGTDPTTADSDDDGLPDGKEHEIGTDPTAADTDSDGLTDTKERSIGTDPTQVDTDGDGLNDSRELEVDTDPTVADTDGDGYSDHREVQMNTDPSEQTSTPTFLLTAAMTILSSILQFISDLFFTSLPGLFQ